MLNVLWIGNWQCCFSLRKGNIKCLTCVLTKLITPSAFKFWHSGCPWDSIISIRLTNKAACESFWVFFPEYSNVFWHLIDLWIRRLAQSVLDVTEVWKNNSSWKIVKLFHGKPILLRLKKSIINFKLSRWFFQLFPRLNVRNFQPSLGEDRSNDGIKNILRLIKCSSHFKLRSRSHFFCQSDWDW